MTSRGPVERATRAQLRKMGITPASSGAAAACIALAGRLDATTGAAAAALAAKELRIALAALAAPASSMDPEIEALFRAFAQN